MNRIKPQEWQLKQLTAVLSGAHAGSEATTNEYSQATTPRAVGTATATPYITNTASFLAKRCTRIKQFQ